MNDPKNDRNPDELQEVYLSDEDAERMIANYANQQELKDFDPDSVDWEVMSKNKTDEPKKDK